MTHQPDPARASEGVEAQRHKPQRDDAQQHAPERLGQQPEESAPEALDLRRVVVDAGLLIGGRLILFYGKGSLRRVFGRYHYFLIVGTGEQARELAALVERAEPLGLRLVGFVHPSQAHGESPAGLKGTYPVMPLEQVPYILHNHVVDEVLVAVEKQDLDRIEPLLQHCESEGVKTRVHLNFLQSTNSRVYLEPLNEIPMLTFATTPQDQMQLLAKRTVDIALALALLIGGLVLLGPIGQSLPFFVAAGVAALPQMIWLTGGQGTKNSLSFHNGYLVDNFRFENPGSYLDFASYWWLNLGLVGPLVILAAILGRRADRKLLVAVMAIFVFGNIVTLGVDVGGHNHKVFNLWETLANVFAAYALVCVARLLWRGLPVHNRRLGTVLGRGIAVAVVPAALVVLLLSGLLDFMTLKNDPRYAVFGDQPAIDWIEHHTSRESVFLTAYGDVYTLPTLAGRSVYLGGFSIWAADLGYDTTSREHRIASIYSAPDRATACERLLGTGVDYIQVGDSETQPDRFPQRNPDLFPGSFVGAFTDGHISYYDVKASCRTATIRATSGP